MSMKVLGILGSPRENGNSEVLLDAALEGAKEAGAEIEKVRLCKLDYEACRECHGCDETGECIVEDDMQKIYPKLIECDRLYLASPVFFMGISAQTKAMMDRCQCLWVRKYKMGQTIGRGREHRKGYFITVGGSPNPEKFIAPVKVTRSFFATLDVTYEKELLIAGVDEKGEISNYPGKIEESRIIGKDLVTD
jgi:multimeric flavodoxin WrbA